MATKTKAVQPGADLSGVLETIKGLHYDDRKVLAGIIAAANQKDLEKAGMGHETDGEGYVAPEPVKETKEDKK